MINSPWVTAKEKLKAYSFFGECIILDIAWLDYGTTIDLVFNNIWDEQCKLRCDLDQQSIVRVRFGAVQEFHVCNALSPSITRDVSLLNWGFSEIAGIRVEDAVEYTSQYADIPFRLIHAAVLWEGKRRIDIVFRDFTIIEESKIST